MISSGESINAFSSKHKHLRLCTPKGHELHLESHHKNRDHTKEAHRLSLAPVGLGSPTPALYSPPETPLPKESCK
eukprot:1138800-Pelagomonas_calceolata.AAC.1